MATQASPETIEVRRRGRQRLIGAVAIVLLLVVFVPMVLDSEPRQAPTQATPIPPKDNAPPLPQPAGEVPPPKVVVTQAVATPPLPGAPAPTVAAIAPEPAKGAPEAAKAPAEPAKVAVAPKAAAPEAAAPKLEGFAVQVGAFRDEAKLRQAREKLQAAGVVHYTERLDTKSGPLTRLRAGPFATRADAEAALVKIKRGALEGKVVPLS